MAQKISELISFEPLTRYKYRLPKEGKMRVDGVFYATTTILEDLKAENYTSLQQLKMHSPVHK
jgi:tRNA-splicing ligase RtcB